MELLWTAGERCAHPVRCPPPRDPAEQVPGGRRRPQASPSPTQDAQPPLPAPRQDRTAAGAPPPWLRVPPTSRARLPRGSRPPRGSWPPWARRTQPPRARGRFQEAELSRPVPDSPVGSCCPASTPAINAPRLPSGSPRALLPTSAPILLVQGPGLLWGDSPPFLALGSLGRWLVCK